MLGMIAHGSLPRNSFRSLASSFGYARSSTRMQRGSEPVYPRHGTRRASSVPKFPTGGSLDEFREQAFSPQTPTLIRDEHALPARQKWFQEQNGQDSVTFSPYIEQFRGSMFPYELVSERSPDLTDRWERFCAWVRDRDQEFGQQMSEILVNSLESLHNDGIAFHQFHAPLALLLRAVEYNHLPSKSAWRVKQLYIAQSQLGELPILLQNDLPVPELVKSAGKGDIYDSSIWLGLEPTYTPLHRDPNPNLFTQMVGGKVVRLLSPEHGQRLFSRIQNMLGARSHSRFRGVEMMQGPERSALFDAIWGLDTQEGLLEAVLRPGDSLFVPKGWWHSVRSASDSGTLNASVNWWFR